MLVVPLFARRFMEQLFKGIRDAVLEFMLIAGGLEFASDDDKLNMAEARVLREQTMHPTFEFYLLGLACQGKIARELTRLEDK
ncbi:MAG: hypothetical protein Q9173_005643 [Seirophora scorigena]